MSGELSPLELATEAELVNELRRRCQACPGRALVVGIVRPTQHSPFTGTEFEMGLDVCGTNAICLQLLVSELLSRVGATVDASGEIVVPLPEQEDDDD